MERTTKTIETPIGKVKVELFEFVTGLTKRQISNAASNEERQNVSIKAIVKSVDGKSDDIIGALDGMHGKDFDFVILQVNQILSDSSFSEKKV